jgi:DNA primase
VRYLSKRGFDYKEIQWLWQIKGIGIAERKLMWRLFIPVLHNNEVVSWTTRSIRDNTKYKYISAGPEQELLPHKNILYGSDYARHTVIIVEGPLDVWRIGPGAVATFGTAFTKQQVLALLKYPRRVVCYDNEKEAQDQALKLCDALGVFGGETLNVTLESKDPDEAKPKEIKRLRKFLE